jgi:CheY-like chemotaxis protein
MALMPPKQLETANVVKADEDKCRAAGMDDYLSKPIDI